MPLARGAAAAGVRVDGRAYYCQAEGPGSGRVTHEPFGDRTRTMEAGESKARPHYSVLTVASGGLVPSRYFNSVRYYSDIWFTFSETVKKKMQYCTVFYYNVLVFNAS